MPKVEVLAEQMMHTDKQNVMRMYVRGQVFELEQEYMAANLQTVAPSEDGKQRGRTALGGRPTVKLADKASEVSAPVEEKIIKPAPAPKPAGTESK